MRYLGGRGTRDSQNNRGHGRSAVGQLFGHVPRLNCPEARRSRFFQRGSRASGRNCFPASILRLVPRRSRGKKRAHYGQVQRLRVRFRRIQGGFARAGAVIRASSAQTPQRDRTANRREGSWQGHGRRRSARLWKDWLTSDVTESLRALVCGPACSLVPRDPE